MPNAPFAIDPHLQSIAIAYRNETLIGDRVLPYVPVGKQEFRYLEHTFGESFTLPDTKVGRKSNPNEIEFTASEKTSATEDHALDDFVPQNDIDNAPANYSPRDRAVVGTMDFVLLGHEKRVADLVFNAASYNAANKVTLSGTDQWSDFVNSDPVDDIMAGLDACLMRPNVGVFGAEVWTKLRQHPAVVKAVNANSGDSGVVSRRAIAELLELDEILVGRSRLNTANKGQPVSLGRVWGKHASFIYRNEAADTQGGLTFGYTARWGERIAGTIRDEKRGMRGGETVRAGESIKELVVADRAGYFVQNAIA